MANQKSNQEETNINNSEQPVQAKRIEGKVAAILNEHEVVLNIGSEAGVEPKMKFDIVTPELGEIIDPDSGEALGTLDLVKTRVEVVVIQHKMCVARTYETHKVKVGETGLDWRLSAISSLVGAGRWETRVREFRFAEGDRLSELGLEERIVRIGDRVRQILEP